SSSSMALLINGREGEWFTPKCGLRQGDPLSPYLFIIVADMISRRLQIAISQNCLKIPKVVSSSLVASSILYADDILLFSAFHLPSLVFLQALLRTIEQY
ncbi:reverse transcriptase domain-containing protein, partial [Klebsiella pneumoniae]|uniref:reverse transcriptase domain-containing protein n=1 Tax=Klebsiella pneumoniae TaxID=573 RepID=UPI003532496C